MVSIFEVLALVVLNLLLGSAVSKECTNSPTQLSSHTFRHELLSSSNETWKKEVFSQYHLANTDDTAWYNLLPRKMLKEEDTNFIRMYTDVKDGAGVDVDFLKEVPLGDVRLAPDSLYWYAQQTNLEYLLMLDVDNLVWSFRKTAGLSTPGQPYGGWESPGQELRGHFVGHYMSASAKMWSSTKSGTLKEKMIAVVSALSDCQEKMGNGYLSAFPSEFFDRFEAIKPVWAPYYTIHKIMAGLLDQYTFSGNDQAFQMLKWMADYFHKRVQNVIQKYSVERHYLSLNEETGGMNDVLYNLYGITGDPKHLMLAHLFDKPCFLGLLAVKADHISGFHANTHIPVVIGAQMRYEITGDPLYKDIGMFFMDIVNSSHSYATGGTSVSEFWSDPKRLASTLETENEESCTTYNMLKVSRNLFRWTKEVVYADYYERALTNGVLGIQRGREPGVMIYMLPLKPGGSKAHSYHGWGTKFSSFWCCYGTAIESFSKLGDSIYFEEAGSVPALYIIQYIPSSFDWKSAAIMLNQKVEPFVSWDSRFRVTLTITSEQSSTLESTLNLRIPSWAYGDGAKAKLNDQDLFLPGPGKFLSITKKWKPGDQTFLELPLSLRKEPIKDDRQEYTSIQAILYGPYLLAGLSFGQWDIETEPEKSLADYISPIPENYNSDLISLSQESGTSKFVLATSRTSTSMEIFPEPGTDAAANSTFRLIPQEGNSSSAIGKLVRLEPYNLPGTFLVHQGNDETLTVADANVNGKSSVFRVLDGLDDIKGTISLESEDQKGCYIYSELMNTKQSGANVKLSCSSTSPGANFKQAVSFRLEEGISKYHPISFVANGNNRSFLLSPLLSLRDESYTVYFNFTTSTS